MAPKPSEKKVHITKVEAPSPVTVRDYLNFRPAPLSPPPVPTSQDGAAYIQYVKTYKYYLAQLSVIRKDFLTVFVQGGSYEFDANLDLPPPPPVLPGLNLDSIEPVIAQVIGARDAPIVAASVRQALGATLASHANVNQNLRNRTVALQQSLQVTRQVPVVIATPKAPLSLEQELADADKRRARRLNRNARRRARKRDAAKRKDLTTLAEKLQEVKVKTDLARSEQTWSRVLTRAEKFEARKAKRAENKVSTQKPGPVAGGSAQTGDRQNRRQRRWAIYGPPQPPRQS